jgi:hypothetical protein
MKHTRSKAVCWLSAGRWHLAVGYARGMGTVHCRQLCGLHKP